MTLDVRLDGSVRVFEFHGALDFGPPLALLESSFERTLDEGARQMLFDLTDVSHIDSSGLGLVIKCHQRARQDRGVVKLVLTDRSKQLFEITRLETMFEIHATVALALASFAAPDGGYRETF